MKDQPDYQTGRRLSEPQPLATDRPPDARQPGESLAAYKAFLGYLENGATIRAAAAALGKHRTVLERYSKRWSWPERVRLILARHVPQWRDLVEYEESHDLDAAKSPEELEHRKMRAFNEIAGPKIDQELQEGLAALEEETGDSRRDAANKSLAKIFKALG